MTSLSTLIVHQIVNDFLLGVWRDEFDVEHIHMYGLIEPGEGEAQAGKQCSPEPCCATGCHAVFLCTWDKDVGTE